MRRPGHQSVDGMSVPTGVNWAGLLTAIVHPMSTAWIGATNIEHAIGFGAAVETYFADLGRVRASGGATRERSSYGPIANLLNAIGETIRPKVFCVGELAD